MVWLSDEDHDSVIVAARLLPHSAELPLGWTVTAVLLTSGLTIYYTHRTLFHPLVSRILKVIQALREGSQPSEDDLSFARWQRRGAAEGTKERSVQSVLDEINAAGHFFYCSAWSSLVSAWIIGTLAPGHMTLGRLFYLAVALLFLVALVNDWRSRQLDIKAFRRWPGSSTEHPKGRRPGM